MANRNLTLALAFPLAFCAGMALAAVPRQPVAAVVEKVFHRPNPADSFLGFRYGTDPLVVVWAFRSDDRSSCVIPLTALRRLEKIYPEDLRFVAVAVGDSAPWVSPFLKQQRLNAELVVATRAEYSRFARFARLPSLFLLRHGHIRSAWSPSAPTGSDSLFVLELDRMLTASKRSDGKYGKYTGRRNPVSFTNQRGG